MVEIVPATKEILEAHFGGALERSVYAIAAVDDGRVLGLAGFYLMPISVLVFAEFSDELRAAPRILIRGARMLLKAIEQKGLIAYAKCDEKIEKAESFLEHIGFQRVDHEMFVWQPRSRS